MKEEQVVKMEFLLTLNDNIVVQGLRPQNENCNLYDG
jgi:hypothetical protein